MSRDFKNEIDLQRKAYGPERRANLNKEILKDSTPIPEPLEYKDIDAAFRKWVDEELEISYEGRRLPTISLFSNQRFSEYMQSWQIVDDKKNFNLNFKTITRENNPKGGSIVGQTRNIPGDYKILLKRVEASDKNNRRYYIDYWMKQPFSVDLIYTVSIVTNKYELLNDFNQLVNDKFKAIDCYIRPNGHFIPMSLNDISDESQYSIDNRQYYSQSYQIKVMAYIIPKDSYIVKQRPDIKFVGFEGDKKTCALIDEYPVCSDESDYYYIPITLTVNFETCKSSYKFTIDTEFQFESFTTDNIRSFKIYVNDKETQLDENFRVIKGDEIKITAVVRYSVFKDSQIVIKGRTYTEIEKKGFYDVSKEATFD